MRVVPANAGVGLFASYSATQLREITATRYGIASVANERAALRSIEAVDELGEKDELSKVIGTLRGQGVAIPAFRTVEKSQGDLASFLANELEQVSSSRKELTMRLLALLRCCFEVLIRSMCATVKEALGDFPRVWIGDRGLFKKRKILAILFQMYMFVTDVPHLVRAATFVDLSAADFADSFSSTSTLYVLLSLKVKDMYVGKTNCLSRRDREHLTCLTADRYSKYSRLYAKLNKIGAHNFVMIQLHRVKTDVYAEEQQFIKMMRPSLNTAGVHNQRKCRSRPPINIRRKNALEFQSRRIKSSLPVRGVEYFCNKKAGFFFEKLLGDFHTGNVVEVSWSRSKDYRWNDMTGWRAVRRKFGESVIRGHVLFHGKSLLASSEQLRQMTDVRFTLEVRVAKSVNPSFETLQKIVSDPGTWTKELLRLSLSDLLQLLLQARTCGSVDFQEKSMSRIQAALKRKYSVSDIPSLTMKIPFAKQRCTGAVRRALEIVLKVCGFAPEVQTELLSRFRVVNTKRKSIADVLHNHILNAKLFSSDVQHRCVCASAVQETSFIAQSERIHAILKPGHFSGLVGRVLQQNNKNIPHPGEIAAGFEVRKAFSDVLCSLERLLVRTGNDCFAQNRSQQTKSSGLRCSFENRDPIFSEAIAALNTVIKSEVTRSESELLVLDDVFEVKDALKAYVLCPLDKNHGKTVAVCPAQYHHDLAEMYLEDKKHYLIQGENVTVSGVLESWNRAYCEHGWSSVANAKKIGSLPYAYLLYKDKDVSRKRTVISYFHHPLKRVFQVCQRGIALMVKKLQCPHFTLFKTLDLVARICEAEEKIAETFGTDTALVVVTADIKEMFTGLPHASILNAVRWLIGESKSRTRSEYMRIPKDKSIAASFGKSLNLFNTRQIKFSQVIEITTFELRNCFFTLGSNILLQTGGAPIGGICSSAYAIATCAYAEVEMLSSLGKDSAYISGVRYVDDVSAFISYSLSDPKSKSNAESVKKMLLEKCYPEGLELKEEPIVENAFKYLETTISVDKTSLTVMHFQKNFKSLCENAGQRYYNLKHSSSFESSQAKRGVIISRMLTIVRNCSREIDVAVCICRFLVELFYLGYGVRMIKQALAVMFKKDGREFWLHIILLVHKITH